MTLHFVDFTQPTINADFLNVVNATANSRIDHPDYGAVLAEECTTALQAAIDAKSAAGGGAVIIPPGTWTCGVINLKDNVHLTGYGRASQLRFAFASGVGAMLRVENVSNVRITDLCLDNNLGAFTDGVGSSTILHRGTSQAADNLTVERVWFQGGLVRPYIDLRSSVASRGIYIRDCHFLGRATLTARTAPSTQTTQAIRFLVATGCGDWEISRNTFRRCGNALQIRHESANAQDRFDTLTVTGNRVYEVLDDPNISTSPYEIFCVTSYAVAGNVIYSGGRGFNGSFCKAGTYSANTAYDQTKYFLELQSCDGINISGNTAYNCKTFVNDTSSISGGGSKNINISGNTIAGGSVGEVGFDANTYSATITMQTTVSGYANWRVEGNTFAGLQYASVWVRIDGVGTTNVSVNDNSFIHTATTSNVRTVYVAQGSNIEIKNNLIVRAVDFTNDSITPVDNSIYEFIGINNVLVSNVVVEDNTIRWSGVDARTGGNNTGIIGIGLNAGAASAAGIVVRRNMLRGAFVHQLKLPYTAGDTIVEDNDLLGTTGTLSLDASIVYRQTKRVTEGTAAPASGTWAVGDRCWNSAPTGGQPKSWVCTVAGTPGTWTSEGNL